MTTISEQAMIGVLASAGRSDLETRALGNWHGSAATGGVGRVARELFETAHVRSLLLLW